MTAGTLPINLAHITATWSYEVAMSKAIAERGTGVYVLGSARYVKIGVTTDLSARLRSLRSRDGTVFPLDLHRNEPIVLLAAFPGADMGVERALHAAFADSQVDGEWFSLDERVTLWLRKVCTDDVLTPEVMRRMSDGEHPGWSPWPRSRDHGVGPRGPGRPALGKERCVYYLDPSVRQFVKAAAARTGRPESDLVETALRAAYGPEEQEQSARVQSPTKQEPHPVKVGIPRL